jgi:curved DNA-binding protein CbpA
MNIEESYFDIINKRPYEIMKVNFDISLNDLIKTYRKLSKVYHPDRWGGNDKHFILLNKCYKLIYNDIKNIRPNFIYEKNQSEQITKRVEIYKNTDIEDKDKFNLKDYEGTFAKLQGKKSFNLNKYNKEFDKMRKNYKIITDRGYNLNDKKTFETKERAVTVFKKMQPVPLTKNKKILFAPVDQTKGNIDDFSNIGTEFSDIAEAYRRRDISQEASRFSNRKDYNNPEEYYRDRENMKNIEKINYSNEYTIFNDKYNQVDNQNNALQRRMGF